MPWPGLTPSEERREALGIAFRAGYETRRRDDILLGWALALFFVSLIVAVVWWFQ